MALRLAACLYPMTVSTTIILSIYLLATGINLFFWVFLFSRVAFHRDQKMHVTAARSPLVSLVICFRNEAENIRKNLHRFLNQTYRSYEIVLVNDNSTDDTAICLKQFQESNPYFRIKIIHNYHKKYPGKKEALQLGIEAAGGEWILVTDADCRPADEKWIENMVARLKDERTELILGYSPYQRERGLLNKFIRFEAIYTATQYLSFAMAGVPYMGVGRNLMFRKSAFKRVSGFQRHLAIASGDDDLLVNEMATAQNTVVCLDEKTFVYSDSKKTWKDYYTQKARHFTTGRFYRWQHQFLLGALSASHLIHYTGGILLACMKVSTIFVFLSFVLRISVVTVLLGLIAKKLRDGSLWKWIPLLDFAFVFYYLIFSPTLIIGKNVKWK